MHEIPASVTERGQVTIPAEVRKVLGLKKRDKVVFMVEDGTVRLRKSRFSTVAEVMGSVPALRKPKSWKQMQEIVQDEIAEEYAAKMRSGDA